MPDDRLARTRLAYQRMIHEEEDALGLPRDSPAVVVTDNGFTANVIEGDHDQDDVTGVPV